MPDLSRNPDDYDDPAAYAHAQALNAYRSGDAEIFAIGGGDTEDRCHTEYGIEPGPGWHAESITDDVATAIESVVAYRDGARLITRTVTVGPWRYVTPEEIETL